MSDNTQRLIFTENDRRIAADMGEFYYDPLSYALYTFPWGDPEGKLQDFIAPDTWQQEVMNEISMQLPTKATATRISIASGHGIGKSACICMLLKWWMSTRTDPSIVVTAGTKTQLATKLWPELAKWNNMAIDGHWYEWQATSFKLRHPERSTTHRADAIPWSAQNPDAFNGTHATQMQGGINVAGGTFMIFDEASTIDDTIWEAAEGATSDPGSLWLAFGNPVRSSGRFFSCFNGDNDLWKRYNIDSRTAMMTNKAQLQEWIDEYGEDSDFAKVRIKGVFPSISDRQLISSDDVERARKNSKAVLDKDAAKVIGVDVARFGSDDSVITCRQGNFVYQQKPSKGKDTMEMADATAKVADEWGYDAIFVDGVGIGAGVVDRLRQMGYNVFDVQAGASANDKEVYRNKRTEMFMELRKWFKGDVVLLGETRILKEELIALEYGFISEKTMALDKKDDTKKNLGRSPDRADSLALTFAERVKSKWSQNRNTLALSMKSGNWRAA